MTDDTPEAMPTTNAEEEVETSGLFAGLHISHSNDNNSNDDGGAKKNDDDECAPASTNGTDTDDRGDGDGVDIGADAVISDDDKAGTAELVAEGAAACDDDTGAADDGENAKQGGKESSAPAATEAEAKTGTTDEASDFAAAPAVADANADASGVSTSSVAPAGLSTPKAKAPVADDRYRAAPALAPPAAAPAHAHAHAPGLASPTALGAESTAAAAVWSPLQTGPGRIPPGEFALHNPDSCLRLLRKFLSKSAPDVPEAYGGTLRQGWISYLFGGGGGSTGGGGGGEDDNDDAKASGELISGRSVLTAYQMLVDALEYDAQSASVGGGAGTGSAGGDGAASRNSSPAKGGEVSSDVVVDAILGESGNSTAMARKGLAAFVYLVGVWCRASPEALPAGASVGATDTGGGASTRRKGRMGRVDPALLALAIDSAQGLVAHGCLDGVMIEFGNDDGNRSKRAIELMAEAVFLADLSSERTELSALKFLLTTGCRTMQFPPPTDTSGAGGDAMLRGTHILQTIRVCYHVYLKTASEPNKTTARAALRQLVASVFTRMERRNRNNEQAATAGAATNPASIAEEGEQQQNDDTETKKSEAETSASDDTAGVVPATPQSISSATGGDFPSPDHRDAFLVLRSLCKLSMRNLPAGQGEHGPGMATGFDETSGVALAGGTGGSHVSAADTSMQGAIVDGLNPAFESKILALDLLLYVLSHTSTPSMLNSGPQFAYAVRHYLCVSLLKNCTSTNTTVVNLSLRLFVPLIRHYRSHLKTEIEAFVTNVFFVILDSENSTVEHKSLVVTLFEEICSDQTTLAEIFLHYDCDLSAVDLFQRIVNTLARVAKIGLTDYGDRSGGSTFSLVAGAGAARAERTRQEHRELRLDAMKAVRTVLQSLHGSIVSPVGVRAVSGGTQGDDRDSDTAGRTVSTYGSDTAADANGGGPPATVNIDPNGGGSSTLVQVFDSKKRRREEETRVVLRFNQKPSSGIKYAGECGHIDPDDAVDVAQYLLKMKDLFEKTQIGEYLGREPDYQGGFALMVLHAYVDQLSFEGMVFDDAIRFYLSGFRLPGEAQKIDRIMEKFAERYTLQNPTVFPNADVAFILAFSIIMLNTDLHNPAIKEERRMTKEGFIRNNRGICDGGDLPEEFLTAIFDRIRENAISLKEDDEAREKAGEGKEEGSSLLSSSALNPSALFSNHYVEMDRTRETNFQKERDQIVRNTESLLKRKKRHHHSGKAPAAASFGTTASKSSVKFVRTEDTGLRDEYVSPMFEVTWAPALAVFSTAMESANGTSGALASIASDEELELATKNAAEAVEVCLNGFQLAICTAGLCGNETARSAFVHALENFSLLGTGRLMEYRHVRCVQTLLRLGRDDGELLGNTWEHIFRALSEVARLRNLFEYMARNDRAAAAAAERRQKRQDAREAKRAARMGRPTEVGGEVEPVGETDDTSSYSTDGSVTSSDSGYDTDESFVEESEMDKRAIDESNATSIHEAIPETLIDAIYEKSTTLSVPSIKEFVFQLCRVSRMEISGYGGHAGSNANTVDLTAVHYRQQHTLLTNRKDDAQGHYNQPDIFCLQKLVEVAHYNMDSRPRLVFADIWSTISAHLTSTALHSNFAVATYAVDSFRQLSIQFLQREELEVYEFQRKFLKPLEAVMARCEHTSVKELLLGCVDQIIALFGAEDENDEADGKAKAEEHSSGSLRSGWRPILKVIGLAGCDADDNVADTGFKMLTAQIDRCLTTTDSPSPVVLRAERFVDLVDALLIYVSGPREDKATEAIDRLVALSDFLADDKTDLPIVRQGKLSKDHDSQSQELEMWWPILLGLSRSVGDPRRTIRTKSLVTLLSITNQHFFLSRDGKTIDVSDNAGSNSPQHGDLQTLQLVFRGVLTPMLEHAETRGNSTDQVPIPLPDDFDRFITRGATKEDSAQNTREKTSWLETTFDHLMDGCVALCLKSMEVYQTDCLIEEVLGMFNSCLISDSGTLAVRGLLRLHKFVYEDLDKHAITDDFWATVCHMLRRCLSVRGLPTPGHVSASAGGAGADEKEGKEDDAYAQQQEAMAMMNEFVLEEELLADRRYIGSNAVMVIGSLLSSKAIVESMGLRWYVFLGTGLGRDIEDWEQAARIMAMYPSQSLIDQGSTPPHYQENALYGRKYMVKFLTYLIGKEEVLNPEKSTASDNKPSATAAKSLVKERSEALLSSLLLKESSVRSAATLSEAARNFELQRTTEMMCDLLDALQKLDDPRLFTLAALTPTFSACMQSKSESIRQRVHGLVQRMFKGPLSERLEGISPAAKKKPVATSPSGESVDSVPPPPLETGDEVPEESIPVEAEE